MWCDVDIILYILCDMCVCMCEQACNNSTKIIEPIQSRCAVLRYSRLSDAELLARLQQVCAAEKVTYEMNGLEAIIFTAEGELMGGGLWIVGDGLWVMGHGFMGSWVHGNPCRRL